jgi:CBS domain-containing protein
MRANQVMATDVATVPASASVYDAAFILLNAGVSAAPVVNAGGKMIGIISEADLMHRPELGTVAKKSWFERLLDNDVAMARDFIQSHSHRVADVMTKNVVSAGPRTPLPEIAALMQRHKIKRIPIVEDGVVVGIVSRANLLQGLLAREPGEPEAPVDDDTLRAAVIAVLGKQGWATSGTANVVSENGIIHLWGYVDSATVKKAHEVAAANVHGVRRVKNHMAVIPSDVHFGI